MAREVVVGISSEVFTSVEDRFVMGRGGDGATSEGLAKGDMLGGGCDTIC